MNKQYLVIRISIALGAVSVAAVVVCYDLGLLPDVRVERRAARTQLCETLGAALSLGPIQRGPKSTTQHLELFAKRNPHTSSLGLRQATGEIAAQLGNHGTQWRKASAESPESCYVVPLIRGAEVWGGLEVVFKPDSSSVILRYLPAWFAPSMVVGGAVFVLSWLTLSRILRHLDPSRVVPTRVKQTLDNFAEGVLLLDGDERVVLANRAFAESIGEDRESLTGRLARDLGWQPDLSDGVEILPWQRVAEKATPVRNAALQLPSPAGLQHFSVNAVPVVDDHGSLRGSMVAFADVTELEQKKRGLAETMEQLTASHQDLAKKNKALEFLATRDPLTGCLNRRSLFERFDETWDYARRHGDGISCIMVDIDYFKSINDNYGHQKGDEVLRATGKLLVDVARKYDLPARYGGEEFCVVLPGTKLEDASIVAERIRERLNALDFGEFHITASLGVSSIELGAKDPQEIIDQADKCLYVAKRNGRNQTVRFDRIDANVLVDESKVSRTKPGDAEFDITSGSELPYRCVAALLSTLAYRDPETAAHSMRVADLSVAIGRRMLTPREAYHLEVAALLHDIGKIGVPDSILLKPGPLDEEEWAVMQRHDRFGVEIVNASFGFKPVTEIVRYHHARFESDGGQMIPLGARIVSIADAFDAMTNDRPYRKGMKIEEACAELRRCGGKQFDPELVEAFCTFVASDYNRDRYRRADISQEVALGIGRQLEQLLSAFDTQDANSVASISQRLSMTARQSRIDDIASAAEELFRLAGEEAEMASLVESVHELLKLGNSLHASVLNTVANSYQ
jgi:diguanylate cyclase (GGDEF)-like protein/PAS domain S-box-containing protein